MTAISLLRGRLTRPFKFIGLAIVVLDLLPVAAFAQKPVIYPAKGQSAQQQQKDDGQCYAWAKSNTGIDPAVVAQTPPPQTQPGGQRLKGAATGAVVGGVAG